MMKILKRVLQLSIKLENLNLSFQKNTVFPFQPFQDGLNSILKYSEVKLDDDSVISAQQIKELQKKCHA